VSEAKGLELLLWMLFPRWMAKREINRALRRRLARHKATHT